MAGWSHSPRPRGEDFWVLKLDSGGNVEWEKVYGREGFSEEANVVKLTPNGGYIVAGWTKSFGAGNTDFCVLKLDRNGNLKGCSTANIAQPTRAVISATAAVVTEPKVSSFNSAGNSKETSVIPATPSATVKTQCGY